MKVSTSAATDPPPQADPAPGATSFDRVYREHFPFVWRCLRGLGVPPWSLDDAAQDVFLVVHRQLPAFRGQSSLRTWLFGILRNVASNHRRSRHRLASRQHALPEVVAQASPGPLERAQSAQAAAFVQDFLAGLDDRKRGVFILGVLEEMSIPDVAAALSIPLNTAYTRLRRTREDFQRALNARRGTP